MFLKKHFSQGLGISYLIAYSFFNISFSCALEKMENSELSSISGQSGVTIIMEDFRASTRMGLVSIGGDDGLNIPAAPDGAYFVFENNRVLQLDVEKGYVDFDVFTQPEGVDYLVNGKVAIPGGSTVACLDLGETQFNVNMSDAILTLKFANNPQGNTGDGITEFSKTVMNFALNGSTVIVKSDDVKMHIYSH